MTRTGSKKTTRLHDCGRTDISRRSNRPQRRERSKPQLLRDSGAGSVSPQQTLKYFQVRLGL
jgi:hypothetical protein